MKIFFSSKLAPSKKGWRFDLVCEKMKFQKTKGGDEMAEIEVNFKKVKEVKLDPRRMELIKKGASRENPIPLLARDLAHPAFAGKGWKVLEVKKTSKEEQGRENNDHPQKVKVWFMGMESWINGFWLAEA